MAHNLLCPLKANALEAAGVLKCLNDHPELNLIILMVRSSLAHYAFVWELLKQSIFFSKSI